MSSEAHQHSSESEKLLCANCATPDEPMQSRVGPLAVGCKIFATVEALLMAWFLIGSWYLDMHSATPPRDAPLDWGTPAYYHRTYLWIIAVAVVALLVIIPNRWLVSSRISFGIVVIIAVFPLSVGLLFVISELSPSQDFLGAYFLFLMLPLLGLWPVSLCLSFWRHRKGERFLYA